MIAPRQLPLSAQPHRNQQLFSDHFLNTNLPHMNDWRMLAADPQVKAAKARIAGVLDRFTPSSVEAQTEDNLVKPVLELLGHTFEVQAALRTPDGTKKPDYVFFKDAGARAALKGKTLDDGLLQNAAFAVGDAKYWDRPLDIAISTGADLFNNKNPSYQIAFYMQHSGAAWGILTNGRLWRLYHKDSAHKLDRFYEVDLPALIDADDEAFLYFYVFFCREAFSAGAGGAHALQLSALLESSRDYARSVSDTLKAQVYDALRHIAQGFLDHPQNHLATDAQTLKAIYDNALIVLYRLLFVLYAEARDLLPVNENASYHDEYSLSAIKADVKRNIDGGKMLLPTTRRLWQKLDELFDIIDKGSPPLKVGTFNGGLFDPARHPFLKQHAVGDAHLQAAVDKLARAGGDFIDYRDLAERHLGTIYEGLLEYHLAPLPAPADGWTVDLLNDKGERKASGSYYTPDYIVKYIVDQAVGPALCKAVAGATNDNDKLRRILEVNVLDPAMGSGHFLVEAVEYIARFIVDEGIAPVNAAGEGDMAYWKRRVAQSCVYGVDLNPLAVELAKLSLWLATVAKDRPLSFLDHHLRAGNSLVGAKLAEVQAFAAAPAKRTRKKASVPENQAPLFSDAQLVLDMSLAVNSMWLIEGSSANTVAEVKEQEQRWNELHSILVQHYKSLADLMTAQFFGVDVDQHWLPNLTNLASGQDILGSAMLEKVLAAARKAAKDLGFFHWEIEFPEVFFGSDGQPLGERAGFDAIVGNPPYVRQELLAPLKNFLSTAFKETYSGVADLYVYFYQQALQLLQFGGRSSYIVTNKWMRAGYGEPLRTYFAAQNAMLELIDFGHAPIFAEADVFPCITVIEKQPASPPNDIRVTMFDRDELGKVALETYVQNNAISIPRARLGKQAWNIESNEVDQLLNKIRERGIPLADLIGAKPYRGVLTGFNEAFVIDTITRNHLVQQDPNCTDIIKPFLRGQDIKRWLHDWDEQWIILLKSSDNHIWPWSDSPDTAEMIFSQTYPSIYAHLRSFEENLRARQDKGVYWWELRSCTYYEVFGQPKLLHADITWRAQFAYSAKPFYCLNTTYIWPTTDFHVLAVLNSPLMWAYLWRNATHGKDEALRLIKEFIVTLPIAPPIPSNRAEVDNSVGRLIELSDAYNQIKTNVFDWLRTEFGVETISQKLAGFAFLSENEFIAEVKKRMPKSQARLSPATLHTLQDGYRDQSVIAKSNRAEVEHLERKLSDLVNQAYKLTHEDVEVMWRTAPPRMPLAQSK